jgi:hypothetical protein
MKKLIFLGCNNNQIPYLLEAKKLNYFIIGTDINKAAPGKKFVDRFYEVDYENVEALIAIGKKENITHNDQIFTAASQFAYLGASEFAHFFNIAFPTPECINICLDKIRLYEFLKANDIHIPPTKYIYSKNELKNILLERKFYFLKSDWSKNPKYIYQIVKNNIKYINWKKDRYLRKGYVLQPKIEGNHFRINIWNDNYTIFFKITDNCSFPINSQAFCNSRIIKQLKKIVNLLGIQDMLVKFDLVINNDNYYVIDLGIDPPMRMKLWLESLGINFPCHYVKQYLMKDHNYPIPNTFFPVLITKKEMDYQVVKL